MNKHSPAHDVYAPPAARYAPRLVRGVQLLRTLGPRGQAAGRSALQPGRSVLQPGRRYSVIARLCILLMVGCISQSFAKPIASNDPITYTFSGIARTEEGLRYGYYFQVNRRHDDFQTVINMIDLKTNTVLFQKNYAETLQHPSDINWHVGESFLKFMPVTDTWVFGFKAKDKSGFNFKVDMLSPVESKASPQFLRQGLAFSVSQSNNLNGHIKLDNAARETFVLASHAWVRKSWLSAPQMTPHRMDGVLCRFDDGSGLYAVSLKEKDALRASVAGYRNAFGQTEAISQFLSVKQMPHADWRIASNYPKLNLLLIHPISTTESVHQPIVGKVKGVHQGFCAIDNIQVDVDH